MGPKCMHNHFNCVICSTIILTRAARAIPGTRLGPGWARRMCVRLIDVWALVQISAMQLQVTDLCSLQSRSIGVGRQSAFVNCNGHRFCCAGHLVGRERSGTSAKSARHRGLALPVLVCCHLQHLPRRQSRELSWARRLCSEYAFRYNQPPGEQTLLVRPPPVRYLQPERNVGALLLSISQFFLMLSLLLRYMFVRHRIVFSESGVERRITLSTGAQSRPSQHCLRERRGLTASTGGRLDSEDESSALKWNGRLLWLGVSSCIGALGVVCFPEQSKSEVEADHLNEVISSMHG